MKSSQKGNGRRIFGIILTSILFIIKILLIFFIIRFSNAPSKITRIRESQIPHFAQNNIGLQNLGGRFFNGNFNSRNEDQIIPPPSGPNYDTEEEAKMNPVDGHVEDSECSICLNSVGGVEAISFHPEKPNASAKHIMCQGCLLNMLKHEFEASFPREDRAYAYETIKCPTCRHNTRVCKFIPAMRALKAKLNS